MLEFLKKLSLNLLVIAISIGLVFGTIEFIAYKYGGAKRTDTYFDNQTKAALGNPVPAKKPGEYRVFVFGSSAAYGFPVSDRHSITAWLNKSFPELLPGKTIKVVNCAWPGKSSYQALEGARTVVKYQPDLFIIYCGNNDPTESNRLYLDSWPYWLNFKLYYSSYFYRWLTSMVNKARRNLKYGSAGHAEKQYPEEVIGNIVYSAKSTITQDQYKRVLKRYLQNMKALVRTAKRHKIKVLFMNVPVNLKLPPEASVRNRVLSPEELASWEQFVKDAGDLETKGNWPGAAWAYEQALKIDPAYAGAQYQLAKIYERQGDYAKAKTAYSLARDYDGRPYRTTSMMNAEIQKLTKQKGLMFSDVVSAFEKLSPNGIVCETLIYDNVHPTVSAQQIIANQLLHTLCDNNWLAPKAEWRWDDLEKARTDKATGAWQVDNNLDAYQYVLKGLYLWENRYYADAIPQLEKALELMPSFLDNYVFLASAYYHTGKKTEALKAFETLKGKDSWLFDFLLEKYPEIRDAYTAVSSK